MGCEEGGDGGCFLKRKFELLVLTESKMKEKGEVSWCEVNNHCRCSGGGKS